MAEVIQVIDIANLIVALAALMIAVSAFYIARKLETRSVSSSFVFEKYWEVVKQTADTFSNIRPGQEVNTFLNFARWLEPYKEVLNSTGLGSHYQEIYGEYSRIMNQRQTVQDAVRTAQESGLSKEDAMAKVASMSENLSPEKLLSTILKLNAEVRKKLAQIIRDPILEIGNR